MGAFLTDERDRQSRHFPDGVSLYFGRRCHYNGESEAGLRQNAMKLGVKTEEEQTTLDKMTAIEDNRRTTSLFNRNLKQVQ
jgi:hypothetical protein